LLLGEIGFFGLLAAFQQRFQARTLGLLSHALLFVVFFQICCYK
jgi:hypothetical protein